ncbi:hypothetical protein PybrP1_003525 [[Pythium] brassicae (nom. inval.)]|nr:hypothetical protein PybrP1_003525 [[Pythium] brassicae (nom. inval.)]
MRAYEATAAVPRQSSHPEHQQQTQLMAGRPVPRVGRALANAFRREISVGALHALLYLGAMTLQPFVANMTLLVLTPVLLGGVVLGAFVLIRGDLSVTEAYTLIAIVNISRLTVSMFPTAVAAMSQVLVSVDRLDAFLSSDEIPAKLSGSKQQQLQPGAISIQNASFRWTQAPSAPDVVVPQPTSSFRLRDVSVHIDAGSLVMIVGAVGAGKSSLLNAMLGEMILDDNDNGDSVHRTRTTSKVDYDILVLDDPLSAVDPHVAHAIFGRCILGLARHRTRVLVLNSHYDLLAHADKVLVVQNGRVVGDGAYEEMVAQFPALLSSAALPKAVLKGMRGGAHDGAQVGRADNAEIAGADEIGHADDSELTRVSSVTADADCAREPSSRSDAGASNKLIQAEDRVKGKVSGSTYKAYFDETGVDGVAVVAGIFVAFVASQGVRTLMDWWQGHWAEHMPRDGVDANTSYSALWFGLWYLALIVACCAATLARGLLLLESCMRSSTNLHDELFRRYQGLFQAVATFLGALVVCALASVWVGLSYVPILAVFVATGLYFKKTSREVKRLDGISRTPVFNLFNETLNGLTTIRAFGAQAAFAQLNAAAVDANASFYMAFWAAARWLAIRMDWLSVAIIFVVSLYLVATTGDVDPVVAGISLTYSLMLTSVVQQVVRSADRTDTAMTSVERLLHFRSIPSEDDDDDDDEGGDVL